MRAYDLEVTGSLKVHGDISAENYIIDKSFQINVSSTEIRKSIKHSEEKHIEKYLHNNVLNYIRKNNLYDI